MKKLLLILLLFVSTILNAQALELIYSGQTPKWAIDVATDEYGYDSSVNGLDLNGSELITTTADRDFSGAGHWTGMTVSGGVGTFTTTASLATDYYTDMVVGHNYTIQGDFKSGASSSFKIVTDNDSSTFTTTGTSTTKAFTFTYSGGNQTVQFKGVGSDTWTADNISITERFDIDITAYIKPVVPIPVLYMVVNKGTSYNRNGFGLDVSPVAIEFRVSDNSQEITSFYSLTPSNTWYKIRGYTQNQTQYLYVNDVLRDFDVISTLTKSTGGEITIGKLQGASLRYVNGLIGEIKFTRKDGTGAVVSTSKYDWKGTSATFLNDKGTNGNHLTGVNVTTADQVKFSGGKYK